MVIKLDSLSFSQIFDSLTEYYNSQAQSQKWKDFYESSTGRLLIRLLSAFASFISYLVTIARRENYITYAQNRTSLIGISQNLGYSVIRGKNEIIELNIIPNTTGFIPEYTQVGTVQNLEIITVEKTQLNKNVASTIKVYIGSLKTEDLMVDTDKLKVFRFISENVSDYVRILLNGTIVPLSSNLKDLFNDMYVALSNPLGAVDVSYIQEGNYKYSPSDVLTLQHIELATVTYSLSDIKFDFGSITSVTSVFPYISPESNDSIRVNAPLYHETQVLIRARNDYLKEFRNLGYNFADTNSTDFSPAIVNLTYIKNDYTIMTDDEKSSVLNSLDIRRAMGVPMPRISDPRHFKLELNFNLRKYLNNVIAITDVESDVDSLMSAYEKSLSTQFDLEQLEHDMDNFSYIKRTRVTVNTTVRGNSIEYRLGDFITLSPDNGKIYMASDFIQQSGATEPAWSYVDGDLIIDNGMIWKCIQRYGKLIPTWYPNRYYKLGDLVQGTLINALSIDVMFELVDIIKYSGSSLPTFTTTLGDFSEDNDIIWVCKTKVEGDPNWQANHHYQIGNSVLSGNFSYECVGFLDSSNSSIPLFKTTDRYSIIAVNNSSPYTFTVSGDKTSHFLPNDVVRVQSSSGNDGYYNVVSSTISSGNTVVQVSNPIPTSNVGGDLVMEDTLTKDGGILWKYYDMDNILFQYNWNEYIKIKTNVAIV